MPSLAHIGAVYSQPKEHPPRVTTLDTDTSGRAAATHVPQRNFGDLGWDLGRSPLLDQVSGCTKSACQRRPVSPPTQKLLSTLVNPLIPDRNSHQEHASAKHVLESFVTAWAKSWRPGSPFSLMKPSADVQASCRRKTPHKLGLFEKKQPISSHPWLPPHVSGHAVMSQAIHTSIATLVATPGSSVQA